MEKLQFVLVLSHLIVSTTVFAQKENATFRQLPEGITIKEGKVQAKEGYYFEASEDGKSAKLINAKYNNSGGVFSCVCGDNSGGSCNILTSEKFVSCVGNCTCKITVIISNGTYFIDISKGVLVRYVKSK